MKVMRLEPSSGLIRNLLRVWHQKPDIVVARLEDGNLPIAPRRAKLISLLAANPQPHSGLRRLLVWAQARASYLFVANDRATGVASALAMGLALDRIRLMESADRD